MRLERKELLMDLFESTYIEDLITGAVLVFSLAFLWYRSSML